MKNLKFKPLNFVFLALAYFVLASIIFTPSVALLGYSALAATVTGTLVFLAPNLENTLGAIQVEIWQNHIEEELFKNNEFLRLSHSADDNVINSKVVHIPQSGGSGNVVKNRITLPATVRKRTDTDVVYVLNEFTTDPVLIPNADTHELSYDKRQSVLGEDMDKIIEVVAEETLYDWLNGGAYGAYVADALPVAKHLKSTGAVVDATEVGAAGATGNRLAAKRGDLQRMRNMFQKESKWIEGKMYGLLDPDMETQLFPADDIITATYMAQVTEQERREGVMYKAHGWKLYTRSSVLAVTAANDIVAPGEAGAATNDSASLFWYQESVEFALGGIEAFEQLGAPQFYGDVYSFLVRTGGRTRRADYKGVGILKQAKSA